MNGLAIVLVALFGMLGTGGVMAIAANTWLAQRREGTKHLPGDLVFERTDRLIVALQQQLGAQAQQIATMGEEIRQMREALLSKEEQLAELKGRLKAAERQAEETEFELNEERRRRVVEHNEAQ